jgi:hypothetical protein
MRGVDSYTVSKLLGRHSLEVTERYATLPVGICRMVLIA